MEITEERKVALKKEMAGLETLVGKMVGPGGPYEVARTMVHTLTPSPSISIQLYNESLLQLFTFSTLQTLTSQPDQKLLCSAQALGRSVLHFPHSFPTILEFCKEVFGLYSNDMNPTAEEREFMVYEEERYTYTQTLRLVKALGKGLLKLGVKQGDRYRYIYTTTTSRPYLPLFSAISLKLLGIL